MIEGAGFKKLDSPRKCIDWAKEVYKWDEDQARESLGLPEKSAGPVYVPGGPFVSTGNPQLDALLLAITEPAQGTSTAPVIDAELAIASVSDDWWHWRESARFDKTINKRPRIKPAFVTKHINSGKDPHFIYCSREEPGKIIYTPDQVHGRTDRRVLTTVGRYLTKHHSSQFNEAKIKAIAEEHKAMYTDMDVLFAFSANEIVWVYDHGLDSCMSKKSWAFENPVRIYDGPDTAVAYIINKDKRVCARALVNIANTPMTYSRIFGDEALLSSRLQSLGFVSKPGLAGARLRLAYDPNQRLVACPYIDHSKSVCIEGDYLVVEGKKEAWSCLQTNGYPQMRQLALSELPAALQKEASSTFSCAACGHIRKQPDGHETLHDGGAVCKSCLTGYVSAMTDRSGTRGWVREERVIRIAGETYFVGSTPLMRHLGLVPSEYSGRWLKTEEAVPTRNGGYLARDEAHQTVGEFWEVRTRCIKDSDDRWISQARAGAVKNPKGGIVCFDPEHLPRNVVKKGNIYKWVDITEKEAA